MTRIKEMEWRKKRMSRPKSLSVRKNRIKSVILSFKASWIIKELKKVRPSFNLSEYVSEHVVRDFEINPKGFLKFELGKLNVEIEVLEEKRNVLVNNIIELKQLEVCSEESIEVIG